MGEVDFSAALTPLLELAGLVLAGVLIWLAKRAADHFGLAKDDKTRLYLDAAIENGIAGAVGRLKQSGTFDKIAKVQTNNAVVGEVAGYLNKHVPDALKHFGLDDEVKLRSLIDARLDKVAGYAVEDDQAKAVPASGAGAKA